MVIVFYLIQTTMVSKMYILKLIMRDSLLEGWNKAGIIDAVLVHQCKCYPFYIYPINFSLMYLAEFL